MRAVFWQEVDGWLAAGEAVFVCCVVEASKGSPGTPGAALAMGHAGEPVGTIGGGAMEAAVLAQGRAALAAERFVPCWETLHHRRGVTGKESGLICGGSQTHVLLRLEPRRDAAALAAVRKGLEREEGTLVIDASGLRVEPAGGRGVQLCWRGGTEDWRFSQPPFNPRRGAIFGGGHFGVALAEAMRPPGYAVEVFEARKKLPTPARLGAGQVVAVDSLIEAGGRVRHPERTAAVVMTASFPTDVEALRGILPRPFPFIGVMGAPPKLRRISEELKALGWPETECARLTAPVGLVPSTDTPEEIAVSVAAQILLERGKFEATA